VPLGFLRGLVAPSVSRVGSTTVLPTLCKLLFSDPFAAAIGGVYAFTSVASGNLREKDDFINNGIGGALAGSLAGLPRTTFGPV
jgi:hypothetical protein